jgi:hypothetical protein
MIQMARNFDDLVAEAAAADVSGWDFGWLDGRAVEERPSWGYQRLMSERLASAGAALDVQTGGGEVLAGADRFPPTMVATESWPPNVRLATRRLLRAAWSWLPIRTTRRFSSPITRLTW